MLRRCLASVAFLAVLLFALGVEARLAFPGCEGDGCDTVTGGSGGPVYFVDSLGVDDDGTCDAWLGDCTLPEALDEASPKIIVLGICGDIVVTEATQSGFAETGALASDLTIIGASGCNEGVQITHDGTLDGGHLMSFTGGSNVILSNFAIRADKSTATDNNEFDALTMNDMDNFIIDRMSISGGEDETLSIIGDSVGWTVSRSIIGPGIRCRRGGPTGSPATESDGDCVEPSAGDHGLKHGRCLLITDDGANTPTEGTVYENLFVGCQQRAPQVASDQGSSRIQIVNNIWYDWRDAVVSPSNNAHSLNIQGNFARYGENSLVGKNLSLSSGVETARYIVWPRGGPHNIYFAGNCVDRRIGGGVEVGMLGVFPSGSAAVTVLTTPNSVDAADAVTTVDCDVAASNLLSTAGGLQTVGRTAPMRDDWDDALVQAFHDRTAIGPVPTFASFNGGLPDLTDEGDAACGDTDFDGLCDTEELSIFDTKAITGLGDADGDGYTDAEEILFQNAGYHTEPMANPPNVKLKNATIDVESGEGVTRTYGADIAGSGTGTYTLYVFNDCAVGTRFVRETLNLGCTIDDTLTAQTADPFSVNITHTIGTPPETITSHFIIERDGATAGISKTATFTAGGGQTLAVTSWSCTPTSGIVPLNDVDCTIDIEGTATGSITYDVWGNCSDPTTVVATAVTNCTGTEYFQFTSGTDPQTFTDVFDYSVAGTKTPKIIVARGTAPNVESRDPQVFVGNPVEGHGPCDDGINCLDDCLRKDGSTAACITKYESDITNSAVVAVLDWEAPSIYQPTTHADQTNAGGETLGADYGTDHEDSDPSNGFNRGAGSEWHRRYGVPDQSVSVGNPGGASGTATTPPCGNTCGTPASACFAAQEWCSADQGNSNGFSLGENCWGLNGTQFASFDVQRAGDYDALVATLNEPVGGNSPGGVFDGNQTMAHLFQPNNTGGIEGRVEWTPTQNLGFTGAQARSSNWEAQVSNIWADREKHFELLGNGSGAGAFSFGGTGDVTSDPYNFPFLWHNKSLAQCQAAVITETVGTVDCSANAMRADVANYTRSADWPTHEEYHCQQGSLTDLCSATNARWRIWHDETLIFDVTFDGTVLDGCTIEGVGFDNYANSQLSCAGDGQCLTEAIYRYEDNFTYTNDGTPVDCNVIGFPF